MVYTYRENEAGKQAFANDILTMLARQAGYEGCIYSVDKNGDEWLTCPSENGGELKVCVSADSCLAMARDLLSKL